MLMNHPLVPSSNELNPKLYPNENLAFNPKFPHCSSRRFTFAPIGNGHGWLP